MARKRSKNKNKKIKMSSKRLLDNSEEEETDLKKIIKLEHKLISVRSRKWYWWQWNTKIAINIQLINRSSIR